MKIFQSLLIIGSITLLSFQLYAQSQVKGIVLDARNQKPIPAATVSFAKSGVQVQTDGNGQFEINLNMARDTFMVKHINYEQATQGYNAGQQQPIKVLLHSKRNIQLEEVLINSGYNKISKEKAVGAFTTIGQNVLERSPSANILSRLEGVANGFVMNRTSSSYEESNGAPEIRVRGVNTIHSEDSPLIVVDNFPYEGNITDINPNDVESVTLLKDAAAASIWGTRAGNGVIVITTKKGSAQQTITASSNLVITGRPNLYQDRSFLDASTIMEIEKMRFDANGYTERNSVPLPDYVELLYKHKYGLIDEVQFNSLSELLRQNDIRNDAEKYLYRNGKEQQYFLNISGASAKHAYYLSGGFNRGLSTTIGDESMRTTLDFKNTFKLMQWMNLVAGINYTNNRTQSNGLTLSALNPSSAFKVSPYTSLADDNGNPMGIPKTYRTLYTASALDNGLLDWTYRPLDEVEMSNKGADERRLLINFGLDLSPLRDLKLSLLYQYHYGDQKDQTYYQKDTYYVRDLVNKFTQADGQQIVPNGGILDEGYFERKNQYGRFQAEYNKVFREHTFNTFIGAEIREEITERQPGFRLYNYDDTRAAGQTVFDYTKYYPTRPQGSATIPATMATVTSALNRFLSYYGNLGYDFKKRYLVNLSVRWDGANIFGVRANQKGTPLWSAGAAWDIHKEPFFKSGLVFSWKLRATYGYSGNVNKVVSAVPIIRFNTNYDTGLQDATLISTGNPNLRWERVSTVNVGTDIALKDNKISASLDYYVKHANDLIGYSILDPTSGISPERGYFEIDNRINYANMLTKGIDLELRAALTPEAPLKINSNLIFNYTTNKITRYMDLKVPFSDRYFGLTVSPPPHEGKSVDILYALPWNGLNGNGNPLVHLNGQASEDYSTYYARLNRENLIDVGTSVPRYTASLRNDFSYKNLSLSFLLSFRGGYKFRRSSINYVNLYNGGNGHRDYYARWQRPGDELMTDIPAMPNITRLNQQREKVYLYSENLIETGDHIRLQDINLSYQINPFAKQHINIKLFFLVSNVGIIWRKNSFGIDPDYPYATYPPSRIYSLGAKLNF